MDRVRPFSALAVRAGLCLMEPDVSRQLMRGARTIEDVCELLAGQGRIVVTWDVGGQIVHWVRMTPYRISRTRASHLETRALAKLAKHPDLQPLLADLLA